MAAFFGSTKHIPVRQPGGGFGYTSRRRADYMRSLGLDTNGNPLGGAPAGGAPAGGAPSQSMMQPFQAMLPGLLANPAAFARPEAAAMLASMFGQAPAGPPGGMGGYVPSGPIKSPPLMMGPVSPSQRIFGAFAQSMRQPIKPADLGTRWMSGISGGSRGPAPNPFNTFGRFASTFGNGGARALPAYLQGRGSFVA